VRDFNLSSPDARLCQSLCIEEPQCTAWVYRSAQGRTDGQPHCWLRNNVVKMKGDNLTISGDVQRWLSTSRHCPNSEAIVVPWPGSAGLGFYQAGNPRSSDHVAPVAAELAAVDAL
jgi:hypothetical protein